MLIVHAAPEMAPFVKVGGLGDVVGSLPAAQAAAGHDVIVLLPGYRPALRAAAAVAGPLAGPSSRVEVPWLGGSLSGHALEIVDRGVRVVFLHHPELHDRDGVYGPPAGGSYGDNGLRFGWFAAAVIRWLRDGGVRPDALLLHDWPAAPIATLLRGDPRHGDPLAGTATALVIHNLAHQGIFPLDLLRELGAPDLFLDADGAEALGNANFLKGGIRHATVVVTVSPTYAREIVWPEFGEGLEGDLLARGDDLVGILNGLDVRTWDPSRDPWLPVPYDAGRLAGKAAAKEALQHALGFRVDPSLPLFGVVSRLAHQKGIDLVAAVAPWLVRESAQLVILGSGEAALVEPLRSLASTWRQSVAVVERFDEGLAHRIYGGADFFLMPSRFEPCGLGQMIALRYGTLPVVRRTGGLADTVVDVLDHPETGNGLLFEHADPGGLRWACERALELFRARPDLLTAARRRGMRADFSWARSAARYEEVLRRAAARERAPLTA